MLRPLDEGQLAAVAQQLQPGEIEFVLGIVAAGALGGLRRKNAVGADDATVGLVAHDQVLAVGIVEVDVDAGHAGGQPGAELLGEDAVAQPLGFADFRFALRQPDMQARPARGSGLFRQMQHEWSPVC